MRRAVHAFVLAVFGICLIYLTAPPLKACPIQIETLFYEYENCKFEITENGWLNVRKGKSVDGKVWSKKLSRPQIKELNDMCDKIIADGESLAVDDLLKYAFVNVGGEWYEIPYGGDYEGGSRCIGDLVSRVVFLSPVKTDCIKLEKERLKKIKEYEEKEKIRLEEERRSKEALRKAIHGKIKWPETVRDEGK